MRILWTSSRKLISTAEVVADLWWLYQRYREPEEYAVTVIHGDAPGGDQLAKEVALSLGWSEKGYPARDFPSPRARNQHLVDLLPRARVCGARATSWASGTGMCARMARRAGIETVDFGVDTRIEARP